MDEIEKISALDELFASSAKYKKSDEFMKLLNFINKFPYMSPFNAFLVHMQNSSASITLSPDKWKKYNRKVRFQSKPYIILIPFGPVEFVYNISDTDPINDYEEDLPDYLLNPFLTRGEFNTDIFHRTYNNALKEGIKYEEYTMQGGAAGHATTTKDGKFIVKLNASFSTNERYSTLVHELAHIYCGHLGILGNSWWISRSSKNTDVEEIEAESVAYLVCKRFGLETSSESYLSRYIKENADLPGISIERILTVSNHIERMGLPGFKSKNK